jgi:hypothetical protein
MLITRRAVSFPAQPEACTYQCPIKKILGHRRSELRSPALESPFAFLCTACMNIAFVVDLHMNLKEYGIEHFPNAVAASFPAQHII